MDTIATRHFGSRKTPGWITSRKAFLQRLSSLYANYSFEDQRNRRREDLMMLETLQLWQKIRNVKYFHSFSKKYSPTLIFFLTLGSRTLARGRGGRRTATPPGPRLGWGHTPHSAMAELATLGSLSAPAPAVPLQSLRPEPPAEARPANTVLVYCALYTPRPNVKQRQWSSQDPRNTKPHYPPI